MSELVATIRWRHRDKEDTGYIKVDCYRQETLENIILNGLESVKGYNKQTHYCSEVTVKRKLK